MGLPLQGSLQDPSPCQHRAPPFTQLPTARDLRGLHPSIPNLQQLFHVEEAPFLPLRALNRCRASAPRALPAGNCSLKLLLSYLATLYPEVPGHGIASLDARELVLPQLTAESQGEAPAAGTQQQTSTDGWEHLQPKRARMAPEQGGQAQRILSGQQLRYFFLCHDNVFRDQL